MTSLTEILQNISLKLGLKKELQYEDLTEEEKATYHSWEETFKEEITVDKVVEFLKAEIGKIDEEWSSPENTPQKDFWLKARMRNAKTLLLFIESPQKSKEFLENYIANLLKK